MSETTERKEEHNEQEIKQWKKKKKRCQKYKSGKMIGKQRGTKTERI